MDKLLPCPFCGGEPGFIHGGNNYYPKFSVQCCDCKCEINWSFTLGDAVTAWNTRPEPRNGYTPVDEVTERECLREYYNTSPVPETFIGYLGERFPNGVKIIKDEKQ